jgi:hypothetical protein
MSNSKFKEEIYAFLGPIGAMIASSKSSYRNQHPENIVLFNANVCFLHEKVTKKHAGIVFKTEMHAEKIWWGDFDLSQSATALNNLAEATGHTVILLSEFDARFEHEDSPRWKEFIYKVTPEKEVSMGSFFDSRVEWVDEKPRWRGRVVIHSKDDKTI